MAVRANWKGYLTVGRISSPVALYTAVSTSDRIAFHILNRATGHRVHREYVDAVTNKRVEPPDQVKGYETSKGVFVVVEPAEIEAATPVSDKQLSVQSFLSLDAIDELYFGRSYYLAPSDPAGTAAFALLRDGMRCKKVAALAQAVLFRRAHTLLLCPAGDGMIATMLKFDYEVRSADTAFKDIARTKITREMLDLAEHIIQTKMGKFEPDAFEDRYEAALADLVKAKMAGRALPKRLEPQKTNVVNLMEALRQSAKGASPAAKQAPKPPARAAKQGGRSRKKRAAPRQRKAS